MARSLSYVKGSADDKLWREFFSSEEAASIWKIRSGANLPLALRWARAGYLPSQAGAAIRSGIRTPEVLEKLRAGSKPDTPRRRRVKGSDA
jgi:hypothetical protein